VFYLTASVKETLTVHRVYSDAYQFLLSGSDDVCVKKDGISPVALQPLSVKPLTLMIAAYMPPKHVGVKAAS
jgi:hypothetical protein